MYFPTVSLLLVIAPACIASKLPIVDLGYELHQAISLSESQGTYNFSNIRYAAPPIGDLRFRAPVPPKQNRTEVQTGEVGRVCPQASPIWQDYIAPAFLLSLSTGTSFNQSTNISSYPYTPQSPDPRTTEDCLFLDVVAPKKIFDRVQNETSVPKQSLAPVLVWIYGGGYTLGQKGQYDPTGLIQRSQNTGDGVVYVALNYRLGAFGWLAGDSLTANGTANAALHDQRLALDWVYKNIHLFGGDPQRVTVMGESAGGGSILHQITAYGGNRGPAPFQQAILQSPGWYPLPDEDQLESILQQFLGILDVSTVEEARQLPTEKLIAANAYQVATASAYGTFTYGPAVDGTFVPQMPGQLLQEGNFDKNLRVMVGHNANEGLLFTPPASASSKNYQSLIKQDFPDIRQNVSNYIANFLYPPVYNGTYGYTSPVERLALTIGDVVFQCNTNYLNRAFNGETYAYMFSIPPALHGDDLSYTFYNGNSSSVSNATVALALQDYITSFTQDGSPNSTVGPVLGRYGKQERILNLGPSNITAMLDPTANQRCHFWQNVPYYQPS